MNDSDRKCGVYSIKKDNESLTAILLEDERVSIPEFKRKIELWYEDGKGNATLFVIRDGIKIDIRGYYADGTTDEGWHDDPEDRGTHGSYGGLRRLEPDLRKKIPSDWHSVFTRRNPQ